MIVQRTLVLACLMLVLAACGAGGGGGAGDPSPNTPPPSGGDPPSNPPGDPPPPTGPSAEHLSAAQNALVRMIKSDSFLIVSWFDMFDDELGFRLERRVGDGDWQLLETLPAIDDGHGQWQRTIDASGLYRLTVTLDGYSLPLHAAADETEMSIDMGPSPMILTLDQDEPLRGNVQVSVQNAEPALSVTYLVDTAQVARSTSGGTFTATLPAEQLVDGQRSLLALVQKTAGLSIFVDRRLQVDNPDPAVLLNYSASPVGANSPLRLIAKASSDDGIASVELFANGNSLQVVTTPNHDGDYVLQVDRATLPSGVNVFRAVATTNSGATVSMERTATLDHFPSLDVTGPFDGMIATNGTVDYRAEFGDDLPGATLTITVGDRRIARTQTSPFSGSYSLANVPPGEYPVIVRVQDSMGKVNSRLYRIIVPSANLPYELVATDAERLLAADDGALLYQKTSGAIVLRNAAGVESTVSVPADLTYARFWFTNGRIVAHGQNSHVYAVEPSGQATDLTPQSFQVPFVAPNLHGPWISWHSASAPSVIWVHDMRTAQTTNVTLGTSISPLFRHGLIGSPGAERLLYGATINGAAGIYSRDIAGSTPPQLVASGRDSDVQSDGTRLMWQEFVDSDHIPLMAAPLNNPTASTPLAERYYQSFLENGLICWLDHDYELHVNDGSASTRLAGNITVVSDNTLKDGRVIFADDGEMHVWTAASGERVWLDALASEAIQADGVAYFRTGSGGTLYRVTLP